ncbi:polysaccharide export outer membrane protein [Flexibacter flexilis DSM 6793]|uniref:Polysaccharide export outer membrane protein n=1 Tax=Flexibacter flexilis DSM 6793 TaxID=927664 RepID=A0A1I1L1K1_9BACT|nr:polysaccharide biosynthesis/export family protein [Flexibacter flexilis]SFC66926.1 polysaccharide export outer membrane protein [Flexibacter flexilis DSM 6793]
MVNLRFGVIILFLLLLFGACKTTNLFEARHASNRVADLDSLFWADSSYEYHIRRDDKITISLWGHDDLSVGSTYGIYNSNEVYGKWLMVDSKGNVEIPRIGTMHVESLSITQMKDTLRTLYARWVRDPIVDVKVLNREITILGEVRDPQVITVDKERNTLLDMITRCKGFEFYANIKYIKVFRQKGPHVHVANINLSKGSYFDKRNIYLYPGDVVVVPSKAYKEFDKRVSTIIPFTTTVTAAAIFMGLF